MMKCDMCNFEGDSVKPYTYTSYDELEQEMTTYLCNADATYWGYADV